MPKKNVQLVGYHRVMWAIVGVHGLYVGTALTRTDMIYKHVHDLYIIPSDKWPDTQTAWKDCRRKGNL